MPLRVGQEVQEVLPGKEVKPSNPMPDSSQAWLAEIAAAYRDAEEEIPFGPLVGQELKPEDLFHLGPMICLKFRGIKTTRRLLHSRSRGCCASIAIKTAAFYLEAALRARHIIPLMAMSKGIDKLLKNAILAKQEFDSIMQE